MRKRGLLLWLIILGMLAAGCSSGTPAPTPTPTRTPPPQVVPTATPLPSPAATATPTPEVSPSTFEVTPFPPDVDPLTGLKVADPEALNHTPLAIKVSNSPQVRPQSGLNEADLVFEHYAEGGITRFTAVFYGQYPERVGSVRSARLIDLEIPAMYQAALAFSGASAGVKDRMRNSDLFPDYLIAPDFGVGEPYFYRVPREGLAFEHTLFADPMALRELVAQRGIDQRPDYPRLMAFSEQPPEGGEPVTFFDINYLAGICTAEWSYDETSGRWLRSTAGEPQVDYLTNERISAANVVMVYANHVETDILEDTYGGGHYSIEIQVWGSGPVLIFRDGTMYNGFWKRDERHQMLTFYDGTGAPLPLKPGNSWIQLVPLGTTATKVGETSYRFDPIP